MHESCCVFYEAAAAAAAANNKLTTNLNFLFGSLPTYSIPNRSIKITSNLIGDLQGHQVYCIGYLLMAFTENF